MDVYYVGISPMSMRGPSPDPKSHCYWGSSEESLTMSVVSRAKSKVIGAETLQGSKTYAVRCDKERPGVRLLDCCQHVLRREILETAKPEGPIFVMAFGLEVVTALGFKVRKFKEVQGKFMEGMLGGRKIYVFAVLSIKQLLSKSGYIDLLEKQAENFFRAVVKQHRKGSSPVEHMALPIAQLAVNYRFPKTLKEVEELVTDIIEYAGPGMSKENTPIGIDTETNTLNPHKAKLKILTLVVSWGPGLAASIPLEHSECLWALNDVFRYIDALLTCPKPKVVHHGKFDLRVVMAKGFTVTNLAWDTLIGEHLLCEDKTGYYGLKALTTTYLPKYAGYEDEMKAIDNAHHTVGQDEDNGFAHIPLKELNMYGACDADVTLQLAITQRRRMARECQELEDLCGKWRNHGVPKIRNKWAKGSPYRNPGENLMLSLALPLTYTLARMESHGFPVDREYAIKLAVELDIGIAEASNKISAMVPSDLFADGFNMNSGAQLKQLLFNTGYIHPVSNTVVHYRDLPPERIERTDNGDISVKASFLRYLRDSLGCVLSAALLDYRSLHKARNTFIKNIIAQSEDDGRMHTTFNITGTATGRLSSSHENMQNIPYVIKVGMGDDRKEYNIKKMFVPTSPDMLICNADAKAAEVRIYAAYSNDPNLVKALKDGLDPHSFFASVVYNKKTVLEGVPAAMHDDALRAIGIDLAHDWSYDDFQNRKDFKKSDPAYYAQLDFLRGVIKKVVFGILYGASKNKVSSLVGISDEQAQAIIEVLFRMFPTIPDYIDNVKSQVRDIGTLETLTGRRRRFTLKGASGKMKARAERQGVNFKIQSTSSDIVMDTMCSIEQPIRDLGGNLLITVHDSLVFQVPKKNVHLVPALIQKYCVDRVAEKYPWLPVPFLWDVSAGPSYGEQSGIETQEEIEAMDMEELETLNTLESEV